MNIKLKDDLPFVEIELIHNGRKITIDNALIDTGSASTIIATDIALELNLGPSPEDELIRVRGVGGSEYVYEKNIDEIKLGSTKVSDLTIDVGAMNYGFAIDAIIGMNFLTSARLTIDMDRMAIYKAKH